MNGEYVEHYIDGSTPSLVLRCVTCGALMVVSDRQAHTQWHEIIQDAITYPPVIITTSLDDDDDPRRDNPRDTVPCRACGHLFFNHEGASSKPSDPTDVNEGGCMIAGCDCRVTP